MHYVQDKRLKLMALCVLDVNLFGFQFHYTVDCFATFCFLQKWMSLLLLCKRRLKSALWNWKADVHFKQFFRLQQEWLSSDSYKYWMVKFRVWNIISSSRIFLRLPLLLSWKFLLKCLLVVVIVLHSALHLHRVNFFFELHNSAPSVSTRIRPPPPLKTLKR